ncbi:MAG TPA: HAD-IA family hydrolase [Rhodocyclaceae bacterium]|nr:HAD-IA family hydrolase [Rhodocyclaceae bacterium]
MPEVVFFDLDGTLADTAPDLGYALNRLRADLDLNPIPPETLRAHTSSGVRGLLAIGLGIGRDAPEYREMADQFLAYYEQRLFVPARLFPGIPELLDVLEARGIPWGIVTNKPKRYTELLLSKTPRLQSATCAVSGDSAARPKPHPDPLLMAAQLAQASSERCVYVGDDLRDVQAGRAAGMMTVAAAYGYLGTEFRVEDWEADHVIQAPLDLLGILAPGSRCA